MCARTFRRCIDRYEESGLDGLLDRRLSQVSHRRAPVDEVLRLVDGYRRRHVGWSVKHYYAWYRRDSGQRSYSWVKAILQSAKVVKKSVRRGTPRKRREPAPWPGMLLHKELAAAGITHIDAANAYLREVYLPAFNTEFSHPSRETGSAFVPAPSAQMLDDIL